MVVGTLSRVVVLVMAVAVAMAMAVAVAVAVVVLTASDVAGRFACTICAVYKGFNTTRGLVLIF